MKVTMLTRIQRKRNPVGKHANEYSHHKSIAVSKKKEPANLKLSQSYNQCMQSKECQHKEDADMPMVILKLFTEFNCGISLCYPTHEWIKKILHTNISNVILFSNKKVEFCPLQKNGYDWGICYDKIEEGR